MPVDPRIPGHHARAEHRRGVRAAERGRLSVQGGADDRHRGRSRSSPLPPTRRSLGSTSVWRGSGSSLILGGAFGNLIDRAVAGYVVDFVDVYWGSVSLLGVQRRGRRHHRRGHARAARHDRPRTTACIPFCLRLPGSRSTPTGCCLPRPTCVGLQFALVRGAGARSRSEPGHGSRHLDHHQRARRRQAAPADRRPRQVLR